MPTTIDQPITIHEDRPNAHAERRHVGPPSPTRRLRRRPMWAVAGIVAIGAALAVTGLSGADDGDGPRTDAHGDQSSRVQADRQPTELDVRGIPTWWSHEPAAPRHRQPTELDVRGIPTWWSHQPAAHE